MALGLATQANCMEDVGQSDEATPTLQLSDKENRPQSQAVTIKSSAKWTELREVDQLKQQLAHEEQLRMKAEAQAGMGRNAKKTAMSVQEELQLQANEIEELKERCAQLDKLHQAASKKAKDQELQANLQKRLCDGKEQAMAAQQKDVELLQGEVQDLRQQLADYEGVDTEIEKLRRENCTLMAKLMALDADDNFKLKMERLRGENSTLLAKLKSFEPDDAVNVKMEKLREDNSTLLAKLKSLEGNYDEANMQIEELRTENSMKMEKLREDNSALLAKVKSFEGDDDDDDGWEVIEEIIENHDAEDTTEVCGSELSTEDSSKDHGTEDSTEDHEDLAV